MVSTIIVKHKNYRGLIDHYHVWHVDIHRPPTHMGGPTVP